MKFKVTVEHTLTSRSVGWVEADSEAHARLLTIRADWSEWHTEDEMDLHRIVAVEPRLPEDDRCRTCGATVPMAGDGWDGECPSCADKRSL